MAITCRTYDRTWREAMEELVELSHSDDPSDTKTQKVWLGVYCLTVRYISSPAH